MLFAVVLPATISLGGCIRATVDRVTIKRVLDRSTDYADVDSVCGVGRALTHPLGALPNHEPHKALVISETVAALCAEGAAWEADLAKVRAKRNLKALEASRADEIVDARLRAERHHALAAARFDRAWNHMLQAYPQLADVASADGCPKVKEREEVVVLLGVVSGVLALFHDKAGTGSVEVPLDRPLDVARAADCLASDRWWEAPAAIQAGAWATVPGSAPDGVDPWALLAEAAAAGDATGIRVARAMQVLIAANAGRDDVLASAVRAFAAVRAEPDPDWILLDEYARLVALHQSDLIWTRERGHRTETLGVLPGESAPVAPADDPFEDDPFAEPGPDETEGQESP